MSKRSRLLLIMLAALLGGQSQGVLAQAMKSTPRQRELEETVQHLTRRLAQLEKMMRQHLIAEEGTTTTPRERELEGTVRMLSQRMVELEKQLARSPTSDLVEARFDQRLEALEKSVEQNNQPGTLRLYWKQGLRLDSADNAFKLRIGGRIMNDWAFFNPDDDIENAFGPLNDGTEFRRARLYVSGTVYDHVEFKAQYDFAGGETEFKDVYLGLIKLPVIGNVRVGHFKEPFSLEQQTSSKYVTFMERALPEALVPARNTGLMIHNHELSQRLTWAVGVFRDADGFGDGSEDGKYNLTGRLTGLPWYEEDGRRLLHLGLAYSHRNPNGDVARFRARPEVHLASRFVDTENFAADSSDLLGIEGAVVLGPLSFQSEYVHNFVDTPTGADPDFRSLYVQGSYFLTGEHRKYKPSTAAFDRVKPKRNFEPGDRGGFGAWEVGARYSYLDLDDGGISGGKLQDVTIGLNWHLNPNTRFMWNYVFANRDDVGNANMFQMRFQIDF